MNVNAYLSKSLAFPPEGEGTRLGLMVETSPSEPLLENEIHEKVAAILEAKGYEAVGPDAADLLLVCTATVDAGTTEVDYAPVSSGGGWYRSYATDSCGRAATITTYVPGDTTYVPYEYTVYTKGLAVSLLRKDRMQPPSDERRPENYAQATIWRCVVLSTSRSTDLRWIVNHMLLAAFDRFGDDTGREKQVAIPMNDERVKALAEDLEYEQAD